MISSVCLWQLSIGRLQNQYILIASFKPHVHILGATIIQVNTDIWFVIQQYCIMTLLNNHIQGICNVYVIYNPLEHVKIHDMYM